MNKKIIKILISLLIIILIILLIIKLIPIKKVDIKQENETFITITKDELNNKLNNKETFLLFTYNSYCTFQKPCDEIFNQGLTDLNLTSYKIPFEEFKETKLYGKVKYAPTIIIIDKGNIKAYLDANSNSDYNYYQNVEEFKTWINKYVNT